LAEGCQAAALAEERTGLHAAIALALSHDTYHRTLTREQHLTDEQAIALMIGLASS